MLEDGGKRVCEGCTCTAHFEAGRYSHIETRCCCPWAIMSSLSTDAGHNHHYATCPWSLAGIYTTVSDENLFEACLESHLVPSFAFLTFLLCFFRSSAKPRRSRGARTCTSAHSATRRLCTRACCAPWCCAASTWTCRTRDMRAPLPSTIAASAPTPPPSGRWRSQCGSWATMARSTRCR
jgi:hypothetical protein